MALKTLHLASESLGFHLFFKLPAVRNWVSHLSSLNRLSLVKVGVILLTVMVIQTVIKMVLWQHKVAINASVFHLLCTEDLDPELFCTALHWPLSIKFCAEAISHSTPRGCHTLFPPSHFCNHWLTLFWVIVFIPEEIEDTPRAPQLTAIIKEFLLSTYVSKISV